MQIITDIIMGFITRSQKTLDEINSSKDRFEFYYKDCHYSIISKISTQFPKNLMLINLVIRIL